MSNPWGWTGEKEEEYEIHEPADLTRVTFLNYCSDPDWSPDGNQIIFERQKEGDRGIYLINADGTGPTKVGPGHNPSWSPVDNRIIYRGEDPWRSLFLIDLDKDLENKVKLVDQINEHGGWSPDGKKIVYDSLHGSKSSSIWVVNSDGSGKTRLTTDEDGYCMMPSFSYDGSKIVYLKGFATTAVGGGKDEPNEIWVMDSDGSNKHMIYAPGNSTQYVFQRAWNKNNKILFMKAWYSGKPPQVWMINADGSNPKPVVSGSDVFGDPVWDNTGTKVAISRVQPAVPAVPGDIWIFSYEEPSEEVIEKSAEEVEETQKNIFQKIWEAIINFFKQIFRIFQIPRCPKSCDDGNPCTQDFCSSETDYQCKYSPIVGATEGCKELVETCKQYQCVKGECQIITLGGCCGNGKCEAGENWETCPQDCELCDDGNPCTQDIYSYETGKCSYIKLTGAQPGCSAKVICGSWTCKAGVCQIEYLSNCCGNKICEVGETYGTCSVDCPNCDDKNKCTEDSYNYHEHQCINVPILDIVCCGNTVCETGETYENCPRDCPNCDDDNACTKDSYDYHKQKCVNNPIIPCCGNGICDKGVEEYSNCPADCPNCDDNNRLTADSFNYETQKCEHIVTHYFIDDFESGLQNWNFYDAEGKPITTAWSTIVEDDNTALKGTGHNWARLWSKEWTNYIFKVRFKIIKGGIQFNYRHNDEAGVFTRYMVEVSSNTWIRVTLRKSTDPTTHFALTSEKLIQLDENWHIFEMRGYDNILNVYIDDESLIKYKDTESPILSGGVAFETLTEESEFLIDDVEIKVITEGDIIYQ